MTPRAIADYACHCGENPLWHPDEKRLYWTDIPNGCLYRYDPKTDTHESCYRGDMVGGFTIQADGALLLFMAKGAVKTWRDGIVATIFDELPDERESRFNDVIADPVGRVYCGTMPCPDRPGRLYRLDPDRTITVLLEGIGCANGMGFTPNRKGFYFIDSPTRHVYRFDYDEATGGISNQRILITTPEDEGAPDGMTVDAQGYLWVAKWGGSSAIRYTPDGNEVARIAFPAPKVSSLTFGGETYTDLYVTTAGGNERDKDGPDAGKLYHVKPGVKGVPEFRSRIG